MTQRMQGTVASAKDRPREGWDAPARGDATWFTLFSSDVTPTGSMSAGVMELLPNGEGLKLHRHAQSEIYYVAEGTGVLMIDGIETVVTTGSAAFIPGEAEHGIRNVAETVLKIFYVFPTDQFSEVIYRFPDFAMGKVGTEAPAPPFRVNHRARAVRRDGGGLRLGQGTRDQCGMSTLQALLADARAVIFDCDGTLVDTPPLYARAWAAGFRSSGRAMPAEWYLARAGMSEYVLMDAFEAYAGVTLRRDEVVRLMRAAFLDELHALREIGAVAAIARENHGRRPMAVASGGSRAIVTATLRATGLLPLFDAVVTLDDVGRAKPEPDLFLEAARRLGVPAGQCLVLEDSREGLEAANRAGMRSIDVADILASR